MNYGFIYCLGNDVMPDIFKIGMTTRAPSLRVEELSAATGVPTPFDLICYGEVSSPQQVEREIHEHFSLERVSDSREFFRGDIEFVTETLSQWCDSFAVTNQGRYLLSLNDFKRRLVLATDDEERVAALLDMAKIGAGIALWREGDLVRFSCPKSLIPHWLMVSVAASKAMLLKHFPAECPIKKRGAMAAIEGGRE